MLVTLIRRYSKPYLPQIVAVLIFQLASTIVLARLLSPHDFGIVAMVLALVGFAPLLIDLGTSEASVQKTHISRTEISTLFWLNISIGGALSILLAGGGSLIALIFGEPALTNIALVLSLTFITAAMSAQHYALMRRTMQFRRIAIIDISANVVGSIVSISMAMTDWGYWSLVAKPIVVSGLSAIGIWLSCPWVPGRPQVTPAVKKMVGLGLGVTGFTVTDTLARSADRLAIGYFYGAGPLGYFQTAVNTYNNLLGVLTEPMHNIAVSYLSKLKNDTDDLKRSWAAALSSLSFFSAGAFAVLAVNAQDFVVILLGQKWAPAGLLLCILAIRGIADSIERTLGWIHVAIGRADRWTRWGCLSAACQLIALIAGLPFGIIGVTVAYAIVMFGLCVPALVYAGQPIGITWKDVHKAIGPQTIAGLLTVAIGFAASETILADLSALVRFFVSAPTCLIVYVTIAVGLFKITAPLQLVFSTLRGLSPVRLQGG